MHNSIMAFFFFTFYFCTILTGEEIEKRGIQLFKRPINCRGKSYSGTSS